MSLVRESKGEREDQIGRRKWERIEKATTKNALKRVGLKSVEGLKSYELREILQDIGMKQWAAVNRDAPLCCFLGEAMGEYEKSCAQKFEDPAKIDVALRWLYQYRPDLNDLERPFILTGDFGAVVIRGYKLGFLRSV